MKKILILGGNGFIGHHLINNLLEKKKFKIYCIDISQNRLIKFNKSKNFFFYKGDIIVNNKWIDYHIRKCDIILPLVAIATPLSYVKKPLDVFKISFEANLPIIKKCLKYKM
jgi:nucleoside-diphosphate-sugar epimerase